MKLVADFALLLILIIAQHGFGDYVFGKAVTKENKNTLNMFGVKSALGQGITSVIFLGLALASVLNELMIVLVISVGFLLAMRSMYVTEILQDRNRLVIRERFKTELFAFWLLAGSIFLISMLVRTLSRPVSDALAYYLVQPRVFAITEKLTVVRGYENFVQSSAFIEMNLASVYSLSGELCTRLYLLFSGLLLLKVVIEICSLLKFSSLAKQILIALLITSTFITNTMADGKTDNVSTYWFMSAFAVLLLALNESKNKVFILLGLLLGLSVLSKISYVVVIPGLFIFALYRSKRLQVREINKKIIFTFVGILIIILINAAKNHVIFSQLLAPFFGGNNSNVVLLNQEWFNSENTKWILLIYPLLLVFGKLPMQYGTLSPLILAATPYFFSGELRKNRINGDNLAIFFTSTLSILIWIAIKPSVFAPRYIAPAYILLLIVISLIVSQVINHIHFNLTLRIVVGLVIAQLLLHTTQTLISNDRNFYFNSIQDENLLYQDIDIKIKKDSLIYLNTYNSGMLSDKALMCSSAVQEFEDIHSLHPTTDIWGELYAQGFRMVITDSSTHKELDTNTGSALGKSNNFEIKSIKYSSNLTLHTILDTSDVKIKQRNRC
jgi:hypothetical protein